MIEPSPQPRRVAMPSWLDLRLVLGVVLVLASVLLGATVVSNADDTRPVVTTTHDLAAGTIVRARDVRLSDVQLPDDGRDVYLGRLKDVIGKTMQRPVAQDELVPVAAVAEVAERTTLTVPFAADAAPDLRAGQRIEVWLSTPRCAFVVLLPDVTVQSVRSGDDGSFTDAGSGQNVVISIDPALAPRVVAAQSIADAQLRAGVLVGRAPVATPSLGVRSIAPSGSASASGSASGSASAPGRAAGLPGDLAACAGTSTGR